jgi:hypothetical protein
MIAPHTLNGGDVDAAYNVMMLIDFVFKLHLMKDILGSTDILSQALKQQTHDNISNAIQMVKTTKTHSKVERKWLEKVS